DHDEIDEKGAELGKIILAGHVGDAEQACREKRAADRAEAADRYYDQHIDEIGEGEGMIEADDLDRERAAEPGEAAAERKGHRERGAEAEAEPGAHALMAARRAPLRAKTRVLDRNDQDDRYRERHADQEQPIGPEAAAHDRHGAAQIRRQPHRLLNGS